METYLTLLIIFVKKNVLKKGQTSLSYELYLLPFSPVVISIFIMHAAYQEVHR
jgi:hypothetical protein